MSSTPCNQQSPGWLALSEFCRNHRKLALYWAQQILRDPYLVDEAVQEAFAKATRYIDSYDASRPILPWMRRIVRQVAKHIKTTAQQELDMTMPLAEVPETVCVEPDFSAEILDESEITEQLQRIADALRKLAPGQRWLLAMDYGEEMDRITIASQLGIDNHALNCRMYRARKAIRELILDDQGHGV